MKAPPARYSASLLAAALLACSRPAAVRYTASGASTDRIFFLLNKDGDRAPIRGAVVRRRGGRYRGSNGELLWTIQTIGGLEVPPPDTIHYGVTPKGFSGGFRQPLTPGRYQLEVQTGDHATVSNFTIADDGHALP
jgi:hypothetical protein